MIARIPGFCGVVGPIISLSLVLAAVLCAPWFSWTGNYLSDLGANRDAVAVLFNSGVIVGGVLTVIFAIGLKGTLPGLTQGGVGAIALILGAIALCCVGIFPETAGVIHVYVSAFYFALVIIALLLIGFAMMREPSERNLGLFIFITGLFICTPGIALAAIKGFSQVGGAIPELLVSLGVSVCTIILGVRLFKRAPQQIRG
jgi:hypothetical membrane protein